MTTRQDAPAVTAGRPHTYAVVSLVAGLVAAAGMFGFGTPVLAVFAVGAGHVALARARPGPGSTRSLATVGLVLGYGLGVWGLVLLVGRYLPAFFAQR